MDARTAGMGRLLRDALLFLLAAGLGARFTSAGPLVHSSLRFKGSCVGVHDVKVDAFFEAMHDFLAFLRTLGPWTAGSISETRNCLLKVERARRQLLERGSTSDSGLKTIGGLLEVELACGIHRSNGMLADPSAAMGLLWIRRGLEFWVRLFRNELERLRERGSIDAEPGDLAKQTARAYDQTVAPFHGWVSRKAFLLSMRSAPEWDVLRVRGKLPDASCKDLQHEFDIWATTLDSVCNRLRKLHLRLDLEDRRKSI